MYVVLKNGDIFSNTDYRIRAYPENVKKVLLEVFKINTPAFSKLSIREGVLLIEGINKSATNKDLKSSKLEIKLEEESKSEKKEENKAEKKSNEPKQEPVKENASTDKKESKDEPKKTSKEEESKSEKKEETSTHKRRRGRPKKKAE